MASLLLKCPMGLKRKMPLKKSTLRTLLAARSLSTRLVQSRIVPVVEVEGAAVAVAAVVEDDGRAVGAIQWRAADAESDQ